MFIDNAFMEFVHGLNVLAANFFTPFFRIITILGEKSWFLLTIAFILCLRKKNRWVCFTAMGSVALGFILADFILKPLIARERPYMSASNIFYQYWIDAGSYVEKGFSCPSGHVLGVSAFTFGLFFALKKRYRKRTLIIGFILIIIMTLSRTYFMHHYLTDCIIAFLLGIITAIISKQVVKFVYKICKKYENVPLFDFALNFDIFPKKNK